MLRLMEGELILFKSSVEARALRRRGSRLLPLSVPQVKPRPRELILTTRRLFCIKLREKRPADVSIKSELRLRAPDKAKEKEKDKDSRGFISSVELKGEREFVVLTVGAPRFI